MQINDLFDVITQFFNHSLVVPLIITLSLIVVIYLNWPVLRTRYQNHQTQSCLNRLGLEQLTSLKIAVSSDSSMHFDRLLLLHDRIVVLSYKQFSGNIFGSEGIEQWTQMIGQKSYTFDNPLFELNKQQLALERQLKDIPVQGYIFFDSSACFPKGHTKHIIYPGNIPTHLIQSNRHAVSDDVMNAWKQLTYFQTTSLQQSALAE